MQTKRTWGRWSASLTGSVGMLAVMLTINYATAANRIFPLHLKNGSLSPLSLSISTQGHNCYEGLPGIGAALGTIPPGGKTTITLARVQGHGCDGKQGIFAIAVNGQQELQGMNFDNEGHLALSNFPSNFTGTLSDKNPRDESYTWVFTAKDARVEHMPTYYIRNVASGLYLIQGYRGDHDDKRNVEVQPRVLGDNNYRWTLEPVDGSWYYIVNTKTGLVLTQDGNDRNVSSWGRQIGDANQHWQFQEGPGNVYMIINRQTGLGLDQAYQGKRNDKRNVTTWPGQNFGDTGWSWRMEDAGTADLAKLTIVKIRCIKASSGKDVGTKVLFAAIEMAVEAGAGAATGGASTAATTAAKQAVKAGLKIGLKEGVKTAAREGAKLVTKEAVKAYAKKAAVKKAIKTSALEAGNRIADDDADSFVELAFDKGYGESPDQLEIRVNNVSVWPNGGRDWREIKSQQILDVNAEFVFLRQQGAAIQLIEYDSGSGDDSLGWLVLDTREVIEKEEYEEVLIQSESEKSVYAITIKVEPLALALKAVQTQPLAIALILGNYVHTPPQNAVYAQNDWHIGSIVQDANGLHWINKTGSVWKLTPDLPNLKLHTGPDNPYYAKGFRDIDVVVNNGQPIGLRINDEYYAKSR